MPDQYSGELTLPDSVKTIKTDSLYQAKGITALSAPGLQLMEEDAATGCDGLKELAFTASLEEIGEHNFAGAAFDRVTFAADCTVSATAFADCGDTPFYGPIDAEKLMAWADENERAYNLYTLTLSDRAETVSTSVRAGTDLTGLKLADTETSTFVGWAEEPEAEPLVLLTEMPERDLSVTSVWQPPLTGEAADEERETDFIWEKTEDETVIITGYEGTGTFSLRGQSLGRNRACRNC